MENNYTISTSPNGNGGWYSSMIKEGLMDILEQNNIEIVEIANGINTTESINNGLFYLKKASDKYFGNLSLAEKSL